MGWLGKYSDDRAKKVNGEDTTLSLLGHEVGHRWLAFLDFSNHDRRRSSELLGRDYAHWSFFFDSDASVMEGNDIEALGGGAFPHRGRGPGLQRARSVRDGGCASPPKYRRSSTSRSRRTPPRQPAAPGRRKWA